MRQSSASFLGTTQETSHKASAQEFRATLANIHAYTAAHIGVDVYQVHQHRGSSVLAATQLDDPCQTHLKAPAPLPNCTLQSQVLGKRKHFQEANDASKETTSHRRIAKNRPPKLIKILPQEEADRLVGGTNQKKLLVDVARLSKGTGEATYVLGRKSSEQAHVTEPTKNATHRGKPATPSLLPRNVLSSHNATGSRPADISAGTNCECGPSVHLELNPRKEPASSAHSSSLMTKAQSARGPTELKQPSEDTRPAVVRGLVSQRGQIKPISISTPLNDVTPMAPGVGPTASGSLKVELIRLKNEVDRCIYLCEHAKSSLKDEEALLSTLGQITALTLQNPRLTLKLLADVGLGAELRKLRADRGYGRRTEEKVHAILSLWRTTFDAPGKRRTRA